MKKACSVLGSAMITVSMALGTAFPVMASDEDYSDTASWYEKCTQAQTSDEGVAACEGFQAYQNERKEALAQSIENFGASIEEAAAQAEAMEALALEQKQLAEDLNTQIEEKQAAIEQIAANIDQVSLEIDQKQSEIDVWDSQIKERMRSEQAQTGTNSLVDLIMGSSSLSDLLRLVTGIEKITESDQDQIAQLNVLKAALEETRSELRRLIEIQQEEMNSLQDQKDQAAALEASYQQLVAQYEQQMADLEAQKRATQEDLDSIQDFVITRAAVSALDSAALSSIVSVDGFINPVPAGYTSAGTWAYASGGMHLGLDRAAVVGSALVAPASGLILYTSNSQPSTGGYLGNWSGYPYGSGNFIAMVCQVGGTTYAITFAHLSQEFYVSAGQTVVQGQTIALTGHSGNSSGPHTHIEVYNLGSKSLEEVASSFASSGDFAFGTGWGTTATACEATGTAPCRVRPETLF